MFNFSANHLLLLSRTEYRSCAVFLMQDHSTRRVYRLYDFTKSLALEANVFYCVAGKVNSADQLYLVIESVKRNTKQAWPSTATPHVTGGEGKTMSERGAPDLIH